MYSQEEFDEQKTRILKYIMYKKRTETEVRMKFEKEIEENLLDDIIEYLKDAKYIDDTEYIKKTVNNIMILKNLSIKELKYKLYAKGLDKDLIDDYIYENQDKLIEYEIKSALNIIAKKKTDLEESEIKNYLLKKGYNQDNINEAFEHD